MIGQNNNEPGIKYWRYFIGLNNYFGNWSTETFIFFIRYNIFVGLTNFNEINFFRSSKTLKIIGENLRSDWEYCKNF